MENQLLEKHLQKAVSAFNWSSFSPEKRGANTIAEFSELLAGDIQNIVSLGANESQVESYQAKFESLFLNWLNAKSNCASSFVTGPSNFPVERMRKNNNREQSHYEFFMEWRVKVIEAYKKRNRKQAIEDAGGPLEMAKRKLAQLETLQIRYKNINLAYRAYLKKPETLESVNPADKAIILAYVPDYHKQPIASYQLTNNNATIKATKERIAVLEAKEKAITKEIAFEGGNLVLNAEADRVQIFHDQKPDQSKISELKKNGFKWAPSNGCWQRQLTNAALWSTKNVLKINF